MTDLPYTDLLYMGCEALWRDTKYALMRRSYALVQDTQKALQKARGNSELLNAWANRLLALYTIPISEGADRNALFHVLGYFKKEWSGEERQSYHQMASERPKESWSELERVMVTIPNPYLISSYVWRDDAWNQVWFRYQKRWYLLTISGDVHRVGDSSHDSRNDSLNDSLKDVRNENLVLCPLEEWVRCHGHVVTYDELIHYRMGVWLAGEFIPYQPLWDTVREELTIQS